MLVVASRSIVSDLEFDPLFTSIDQKLDESPVTRVATRHLLHQGAFGYFQISIFFFY